MYVTMYFCSHGIGRLVEEEGLTKFLCMTALLPVRILSDMVFHDIHRHLHLHG